MINTFDIDGVIYMGDKYTGVFPGPSDIIITGRSFEERHYTEKMLMARNISNHVYYNNKRFEDKTRESSGLHKANTIRSLLNSGYEIGIHFEDDEIQAQVISNLIPEINVVILKHNLVDKENVWHGK